MIQGLSCTISGALGNMLSLTRYREYKH